MRSLGTATVLITLLMLTGCASGDGDADDVPTITTRPSTPATSTSTDATTEPTDEPSTAATETTTPPTETATATETGPSPEPPTDEPVGPTTYRQALARIDAVGEPGTAPLTTPRFSTAGDVVYCLLDDPVIGPACELRTGFIEDDDVCGAAAEGVGRIETFEREARPVCNTDTIREPGARVIRAPAVVEIDRGRVLCAVERDGVTCVERGAEVGFFLAPGEYHVF